MMKLNDIFLVVSTEEVHSQSEAESACKMSNEKKAEENKVSKTPQDQELTVDETTKQVHVQRQSAGRIQDASSETLKMT